MTRENDAFEEAMEWQRRLQDGPETDAVARAFTAWLTASSVNFEAWSSIENSRMLAQSGAEAQSPATYEVSKPTTAGRGATSHQVRSRPRRRQMFMRAAAVLGVLITGLAAALFGGDLYLTLTADHRTARGETRVIRLADGSTVQLSGGSAITKEISSRVRQISLLAGAAYFEVQPKPSRLPFVVRAGDASVRAIGTAFEVRRISNGAAVAVAEGKVRVREPVSDTIGVELTAKQAFAPESGSPRPIMLDEIAAWRRGRLFVDDWPATAVLAAIAQHYKGRIIYSRWLLQGRRVTGAYDLSEPVTALRLIAAIQNLRVIDTGTGIIFVSPI